METYYYVGIGALIIGIYLISFLFNRKMKNKTKSTFESKYAGSTKVYTKWKLISLNTDTKITHVNSDVAHAFKSMGKEGVNVPYGEVELTIYAREESNLGAVTSVKEYGPLGYNVFIEEGKEYTLTVNANTDEIEFEEYIND